jgi:hypothetical protein
MAAWLVTSPTRPAGLVHGPGQHWLAAPRGYLEGWGKWQDTFGFTPT